MLKRQKPRGASLCKRETSIIKSAWLKKFYAQRLPLSAGFLAGIFVTVACQFFLIKQTSQNKSQTSLIADSLINKNVTVMTDIQPIFDFYTLLPKGKGEDLTASLMNGNSTDVNTYSISDPVKTAGLIRSDTGGVSQISAKKPLVEKVDINPKSVDSMRQYILQAASLREVATAEKLKENMRHWGLNAEVRLITAANGIQWYRVQTGPYSSLQNAKDAKNILLSHGIKGLLVRN